MTDFIAESISVGLIAGPFRSAAMNTDIVEYKPDDDDALSMRLPMTGSSVLLTLIGMEVGATRLPSAPALTVAQPEQWDSWS
jgi:hypothetical protein